MKKKNHSNVTSTDILLKKTFNLNSHIASVHDRKKHFKCKTCGTAFTEKTRLNSHITNAHERPRKCEICAKVFKTKQGLIKHINSQKVAVIHKNLKKRIITKTPNLSNKYVPM